MLAMSKKRSRTDQKRAPKTIAFWSFIAVAAVATVGGYVVTETRDPDMSYTSSYVSADPAQQAADAVNDGARLARNAFSDVSAPQAIAVIGDSTGDEPDEWVYRVGTWASAQYNRTVILHRWDSVANRYIDPPVVLGTGAGAPLDIWNASAPGKDAEYSAVNLPVMLASPVSTIFISHGHNQATSTASRSVELLTRAALNRQGSAQAVVIGQNPNRVPDDTDQQAKVEAILGYAASAQLPSIDVLAAFNRAGDPNGLLEDKQHPNTAGSQVWADTVIGWLSAS